MKAETTGGGALDRELRTERSSLFLPLFFLPNFYPSSIFASSLIMLISVRLDHGLESGPYEVCLELWRSRLS